MICLSAEIPSSSSMTLRFKKVLQVLITSTIAPAIVVSARIMVSRSSLSYITFNFQNTAGNLGQASNLGSIIASRGQFLNWPP